MFVVFFIISRLQWFVFGAVIFKPRTSPSANLLYAVGVIPPVFVPYNSNFVGGDK